MAILCHLTEKWCCTNGWYGWNGEAYFRENRIWRYLGDELCIPHFEEKPLTTFRTGMLHLSSLQPCGRRGILSSIDPPMISNGLVIFQDTLVTAPLHCPPTPNKTQATEDFTSTSEWRLGYAWLVLEVAGWFAYIASGLLHGTSSIYWVCLKIRHAMACPIPMDYQTSPQFGKAISQEIQTHTHWGTSSFFKQLAASRVMFSN